MLHPAVETCLYQRKVGVRELDEGNPRTYANLCRCSCVSGENQQGQTLVEDSLIWVCQRPSGTGSGGVDNLLIMHCWHYLRSSWF